MVDPGNPSNSATAQATTHQPSLYHCMVAMATRPPGGRSRGSSQTQITTVVLGPVDGFDQDEGASESDECAIAVLGLVTAHGDLLETLQLADGLLDPGAGLVEQLREKAGSVLRVLAIRDDRDDATTTANCAVGCRVVALVGDRGTRRDIGTDVERNLKLRGIADLAAG